MATSTLKTRIKHKIDTASNWASSNLVPLEGELVIYKGDKPQIKVGDGSTVVGSLPFIKAGSDITVTQVMASGTKIASIEIDGVLNNLYAPSYSFSTGSANGTIAVNGVDVVVKGLGTRAFDSAEYLPLSGGTLTGSLSLNGDVQAYSIWSKQTSAEASVGVQNGALNSQLYLYANSSACGLYFSNSGNGANGNVIRVTADGINTFHGNITGAATRLATARTISLTGSVTGSGSFDGSGNLSIDTTTNHTHTSLPDGTTISGHLRVGNNINGDTNYIAFYGTQGDQPGSYNHTFIGENLYGTSEASELIIFKGNDIGNGPTVPSEPGPERIRHIAATHLFQSYTTALLGSFVEICDSTVPINIMGIDSAGVYVYKNLTVNGTLTGNLNGNAATATYATHLGSSSADFSAGIDGNAVLLKARINGIADWAISRNQSNNEMASHFYDKTTGNWVTGRVFLDSGNYSGYALPLSGGTLSGPVYTTSAFTISAGTVSQFASAPLGGLFSNGVAFTNPTTRNDVGWIRILGTGESDTVLEIAVGDDGGGATAENIAVRQYNTSNTIAREAYLLNAAGNTTFPGSVTAASVYGAVWNDYAEFRQTVPYAKPGQIVTENGNGTQRITTERLQRGCNVVSDTFGFAIGETDDCKTPIACAGRALVYTYENRYDFQPGEAVCSGPNGTVSRMTREEMINNPDCIVGFVSEIPEYEVWGTGNVEVDGRIWIKVK